MDDENEEQDRVASMQMEIDLCNALIERHDAIDGEGWKIRATLELFLEMLRMEAEQCDNEDHLEWASNDVSNLLTVLLYVDRLPTEDEIEQDVLKFRRVLDGLDEGGD